MARIFRIFVRKLDRFLRVCWLCLWSLLIRYFEGSLFECLKRLWCVYARACVRVCVLISLAQQGMKTLPSLASKRSLAPTHFVLALGCWPTRYTQIA